MLEQVVQNNLKKQNIDRARLGTPLKDTPTYAEQDVLLDCEDNSDQDMQGLFNQTENLLNLNSFTWKQQANMQAQSKRQVPPTQDQRGTASKGRKFQQTMQSSKGTSN